jgi:phosphoglycolate phosphatase
MRIIRYLGVPLWKIPLIGGYMKFLMAQDTEQISLFSGIDEMLAELSDKLSMVQR